MNQRWKGSFTNTRTKYIYVFMFNPLPVDKTCGWSWDVKPIPGRSHAHRSGGAGDGESLTFTLYLDGSRGLLEVSSYPDGGTVPENRLLNVQAWVRELEVLTRPADALQTNAYGSPDTIFLNLKGVFTGEGVITSVSISYTETGEGNVPTKAECNVSFEARRRSNQTSDRMRAGLGNDELLPIL